MTETNLTVANIILAQLGGSARLTSMIGAKCFTGTDSSLSFRFSARASNGSNTFRVTLDPSDTYTLEFLSVRGSSLKVKYTVSEVYADDLIRIFEEKTGLYLSL